MFLAHASLGRRFLASALITLVGISLAWSGIAVAKMAPVPQLGKRAIEQTPLPTATVLARHVDGIWNVGRDDAGVVRRLTRLQPASAPTPGRSIDAQAVARDFLIARRGEMKLTAGLADLELENVIESPGGFHVRYRQTYQGVVVDAGAVWVTVSLSGQVVLVTNEAASDLSLDVHPTVSAESAISAVRQAVGATGTLHAPQRADLVVRRYEGRAYLAWKTLVPADEPFGDWEAFVDAHTGQIIELRDRVQFFVEGTGKMWHPNPVVRLQNNTLTDQNDADQAAFDPAYYNGALHELDAAVGGVYRLRGHFASSDEIESPVVTLATNADANGFLYTRANDFFEEVVAYRALDATERKIQDLGFTNVNNRIQHFDSHGVSGDDNSHYVPSTKIIAYGDGCVDDSEDDDVIIHEYGHSIQDNQVPGWGASAEAGAMGEGFGDYLAGTMSMDTNPTFQPAQVFDWDKGPVDNCWAGRRLDGTKHYPEDLDGEVHDDGELWSAVNWQCANAIGMDIYLRIVLESQFDVPTTGSMVDAGNAIVAADQSLYGGAHVSTIVYYFDLRGILDAADFIPSITHTPLTDTEDTIGPYVVTALIVQGAAPLNPDSLLTVYRVNLGAWTRLLMTATGNTNEFAASIPGQPGGSDVDYYVAATDASNGRATHPVGAPTSFHRFHIGPDLVPPVITHTALRDYPLIQWPARVRARVTDNLGIASVAVEWSRNGSPETGFPLVREGTTDYYSALFPVGAPPVAIGDSVSYLIRAIDSSSNSNQALAPATGVYGFKVIDVLGVVLVIDDWGTTKSEAKIIEEKGGTFRIEPATSPKASSASKMARWLSDAGYAVTQTTSPTTDPGTWPDYSFIISTSADNTSPVANATYRAALEAYVAAGNKLLIEGGEVGYDAISSPGYPTFAANVLHGTTWHTDNAGALVLRSVQATHPIATTPNALPATLGVTYVGYGDEDANDVATNAYVVYGTTSYPNAGGVHVYDDNPDPQSAQIVDFNFNLGAITDSLVAKHLLENSAAFLMARESSASGGISGRVDLLGTSNDSGVIVTAGTKADTTDAGGNYLIAGLYPGTYTVQATKTGYATGVQSGVVVLEGQTTPNINFSLSLTQTVTYCASPALAIPDNNTTGVTSTITVPDGGTVSGVLVSVNITHTWKGDLEVSLISPLGTTVILHNRTGSSTDNIITTYDTLTPVDGPGTLADFRGQNSLGGWKLKVRDLAASDTGTLNSWCVILTIVSTTGVQDADATPRATRLYAAQPNPVSLATTIRYDLAASGRVSLALYDAGGRLVRTLQNGALPAGRHQSAWDGRNDAGAPVAAGVYFARLDANGQAYRSRIVLLK